MALKPTVIVNPRSAGGRTANAWPTICDALKRELGGLSVALTTARFHAVELTRNALKSGADTILAIGGDGTLNEVVNGFFERGEPVNPSAALAFLSSGTGSDFVKSWGGFASIHALAAAIRARNVRPCDVVRATLNPVAGSPGVRHFINVADVGIGGAVVEMVNRSSKRFGGTASFLLAGVRAALFRKNAPLRLELDGVTLKEQPHFLAAIANGRYFGGGMHVAPNARLDDGLFDVVLTPDFPLPQKIRFAAKLYNGEIGDAPDVEMLRGRRLRVSSSAPVWIEADGELIGATDAALEIVPSAIRLIQRDS